MIQTKEKIAKVELRKRINRALVMKGDPDGTTEVWRKEAIQFLWRRERRKQRLNGKPKEMKWTVKSNSVSED